MKISARIIKILFAILLLFASTSILKDRYRGSFAPAGTFPFGAGNAPNDVRTDVSEALVFFQKGYAERDPALVESFMDQLFSSANTVVLGTMPKEIYVGFARATELVRTDWQFWGDCRFDLENTHVSSQGDVAWFSTVGYVEFDLSSFLVLPLRLSGVMVQEQEMWQIQHLQFQFDLDLTPLFLVIFLFGIWLAIQLVWLVVIVLGRLRKRISGHETTA